MPGPPVLTLAGEATASPAAVTGSAAAGPVALAGDGEGSPGSRYSLQVVDFDRARFGSVADCFTAASAQQLPFDLCR